MKQLPGQSEMIDLLLKAADATAEGITISSMLDEDQPLVYINEGFVRMTGYDSASVIGRNCRFLQGVETDPLAVTEIRRAINSGSACTTELINYRKDGSKFWNRLSITPIRDDTGRVTHYVGIQSDITAERNLRDRLSNANQELRDYQKRISEELDQAKEVQEHLLPAHLPTSEFIRFSSKFVPMDRIGGDTYDMLHLNKHNYGVLVADVTGHGIPAALLTFITSTTFRRLAKQSLSPSAIFNHVNLELLERLPVDAFVTMFYGIYNTATRVLKYCQAGHPDAYVMRPATSEVITLKAHGTLLGIFENEQVRFDESSILLQPGDKVFFYTDALLDALGSDGLTEQVSRHVNTDLDTFFEHLYSEGLTRLGVDSYGDDFTLVGFEVTG